MSLTIPELRRSMARLTEVMMARNEAYLRREAELEDLYRDRPLVLKMRLADDYELNKASGAAKTCAVLAAGIAAVIQAEIAWIEHHRPSPARQLDR